ncbi:TPM domain-containing protein [Novosphingobium beihaiensis]|uniref:TPM domain-containing protein n=1 Tax=Novosphingobium beihaiensis TaxID=2930389 RepID=A0ABT0BJY7_9SPHN|nr:TPM domain-containing protein [Novosphingobium beihaiensis]MCJ2185366.1 TPM domain-containing protein [Novosphingobium beihaiensis]
MKAPFRHAVLPLVLAATGCGSAAPPFTESTAQPAGEALHLQGRVNDAASILDFETESRLTAQLQTLEKKTGHQMVVVTVRSLGGEEIANYTRTLANRWGISRKGHDDGVVILVAPNERKVRIAVGYGLEKVLTNAACSDVIQSDMIPRFRAGDFAGGIEAAVASLSAKLS